MTTITKYIKDAKHKYMSRINKEMIQETCDINGIFLVCGSYTFNREIKELLLQLNINNANIIEY
jgi:ferredoxin-NADP reductase